MTRLALLTDLHLVPAGETYLGLDPSLRCQAALAAARAAGADGYFFLGDYSFQEPSRAATAQLGALLASLDQPAHLLAGNHDETAMLREMLGLPSGPSPHLDYTVPLGEFTAIVLDSSRKFLDEAQLAWLSVQLATQLQPLLFVHHPPLLLGVPFMDEQHPLANRSAFLDVLLAYGRPLTVFSGHYHCAVSASFANVTVFVVPPTSFYLAPDAKKFLATQQPPGYALVDLSAGRVCVRLCYA
ncbi:MAG: hypothetical protein HC821_00300 [Lewinella sp.]|nr:hypothetical protein [Lewinella sp.]